MLRLFLCARSHENCIRELRILFRFLLNVLHTKQSAPFIYFILSQLITLSGITCNGYRFMCTSIFQLNNSVVDRADFKIKPDAAPVVRSELVSKWPWHRWTEWFRLWMEMISRMHLKCKAKGDIWNGMETNKTRWADESVGRCGRGEGESDIKYIFVCIF